jgi:hypothetical protein
VTCTEDICVMLSRSRPNDAFLSWERILSGESSRMSAPEAHSRAELVGDGLAQLGSITASLSFAVLFRNFFSRLGTFANHLH